MQTKVYTVDENGTIRTMSTAAWDALPINDDGTRGNFKLVERSDPNLSKTPKELEDFLNSKKTAPVVTVPEKVETKPETKITPEHTVVVEDIPTKPQRGRKTK